MKAKKTKYNEIRPFITKDRSVIRELMHPKVHGNKRLSLAEATVHAGLTTSLHRHHKSEEIYHIIAGQGQMTLGDEDFKVVVGDTICIPPGTPHQIRNAGKTSLKLLCSSSPSYTDDDTELLISS